MPTSAFPSRPDMPDPYDADAAYDAFASWAADRGTPLYPAQDESIVAIVSGENVILSTPTGTGKSLVAVGAHAVALAQGIRTYYTAPIKALVSEKFFDLVEIFGAENVGMVTGDSSVNPDAPIICATAEILANLALRHGEGTEVGQVVMDEFHFYSDPDRGWAWQVPILTLPGVQFVLMSATLGEVDWLAEDLSRRTGRETTVITGVDRPVPLSYSYATTPIQETVEELLATQRAPIYIVHFAQLAAVERAQALSSITVATRAMRDEIAELIGPFRFTTAFGKTLSRLLRLGIGVHHAGMLPKYRRLVERLAQRGLLRVICGTDTLGVGINVPIRTVLLSALTKFDGTRMRQLTAREFHQIAGRAGRAGFDTAGTVVVQAPEHETENLKALAKMGDDPKKRRKFIRKKAPEGFVSWGEPSFEKLIAAQPERLTSHLTVTHAMVLNTIARGGDVFTSMRELLEDNHEPRPRQRDLIRQALAIYRTLRTAGVVEEVTDATTGQTLIRLTVDLQPNFALNQPLSPFALAVYDLLDEESPTFALDVVSVTEAILDDPRPVLSAQQFVARGEAVQAMKAEGIEYEQRMELLDEVTYPKPLAGLLGEAFDTYRATQPWIGDFDISPKSVIRDMYERAMSFGEYTAFYRLARSEGLVLRYLSDAYRTLRTTVPDEYKNDDLLDLIEWLGELVRQTDSSVLDEWEALINPEAVAAAAAREDSEEAIVPPAPRLLTSNPRAFRILVRNELFRRVTLAAREAWTELGELDAASGFSADRWASAMDDYYDVHDSVGIGPHARSAALLILDETPTVWRARQIFDDPAGDHDWGISAEIDLAASNEAGVAVVRVVAVDQL
ncbi:Helicase conserved C-terminal domain-containing protein [Herbiconiux ginsengi]|uniref:Helicase conserved C-terminal domain-containing protein n=2 Tax=Herbiconiux ginsengi TaxID=381665 RepID=A0A1H3QIM0_9MICO|nr:Helicase conserved C-terminal domain-containing protein [Herbiconiux ginsengi]